MAPASNDNAIITGGEGTDCVQSGLLKDGLEEGNDDSTLMSEDREFEEDLKQFSLRLHSQ